MQPIAVTAHFDPQGRLTPLEFAWQGRLYQVTSVGRRWRTSSALHLLVMVPPEKVVELLFVPAEGRWYLKEKEPRLPPLA